VFSRRGGSELSFPNESSASCCAFLCDNDGQIIGDVRAQLPGSSGSASAGSLVTLIEHASLMAFLEAVRTRGVTLGWEMRIHYGGSPRSLLLHGSQTPLGILVLATLTPREEDAARLPNAVHDLNNPISSIISACEYLAVYSQENLTPEQVQMIIEIESAARTLLQLSGRIADLSNPYGDSRMADAASSAQSTLERE